MTTATLTVKNLGRNRLRSLLTVAGIALPMLAFTMARSFVDGYNRFLQASDNNLRVAVHQKLTFTTWLPQRMREDIEAIAPPGYLTAVCRAAWFGGKLEDSQVRFASLGFDRDTFPQTYSEFAMTPEEIEAFTRERRGAVVGPALAKKLNWKIGDRVTLTGGLPPFPKVEFVIAAIPAKMDREMLCFAFDYYNEVVQEATGEPIGVNNFWVKCGSPQARAWALEAIDKHFSNTDHETRTEMESTFIASFVQSGGDWVGLVWTVGRLIVLVAVAVAFNTMSQAFRERTRELAVMRALGFSGGYIVRMVLLEGVILGLIGGVIGVLPLYALTHLMEIRLPEVPIPVLIAHATMAMALGTALICGVLAALAPAVMAGRLRVATALRKVV